MTLEEAKEMFPPGTIFCPAHLEHRKNNSMYHIRVEKNDTFKLIGDNNIVLTNSDRTFEWHPMIMNAGKIAKIISKPELKSSATGLPKKWYIEATEENISLLRDWQQKNSDGSYNSFGPGDILLSKHEHDSSFYYAGSLTSFRSDTYYHDYVNITFEEFKKAFYPHKLHANIDSSIPEEWCIQVTDANEIFVNQYRQLKIPEEGSISRDYKYMHSTGWGRYNNIDDCPVITTEQLKSLLPFTHSIDKPIDNGTPSDLGAIEFLRDYPEILDRIKKLSEDKSLIPFTKNLGADKSTGGFNWANAPESKIDSRFWEIVLGDKNPRHFYTLHPKESNTESVKMDIEDISGSSSNSVVDAINKAREKIILNSYYGKSKLPFFPIDDLEARRDELTYSSPTKKTNIQIVPILPVKKRKII